MPNHVVHDRTTIAGAAIAVAVGAAITRSPVDAAVLGASVLVSGTLLSPDLDIFVNPSWKYVLAPRGGFGKRWRKRLAGAHGIATFGPTTMSRPLRRWGVLRTLWTPYRAFLFLWWLLLSRKRGRGADTNFGHRSLLSHTPVLADLLRLGYLGAIATGGYALALSVSRHGGWAEAQHAVAAFVASHQHIALLAWVGCSTATAIHSLLDRYIPD